MKSNRSGKFHISDLVAVSSRWEEKSLEEEEKKVFVSLGIFERHSHGEDISKLTNVFHVFKQFVQNWTNSLTCNAIFGQNLI